MFAKVKDGITKEYKYCKKSTKNMQSIFGDIVKNVFLDSSEFAALGKVENGNWDGLRILVEFSNGRFVSMHNSEWAFFYHEPIVEII